MDDEDRQLISSATKAGGTHADTESRGAFARLSVKLRDAIERSEASANALGDRIWWLNFWLLLFTIAIFALNSDLDPNRPWHSETSPMKQRRP
jgi:hypothetical protein